MRLKMKNQKNRQFLLATRPVGTPTADNWDLVTSEIPTPNDGEVLLKTIYISLDPAMRGWMNEGKSYIRPVQIGEVMRAGVIGRVIESKDPNFQPGDFVNGKTGVQEYAVAPGNTLFKVEPKLAPLPTYLGTLGMPGMTAYFGLLKTGQPKEGETVVISGAAGAVGTAVGQIANIKGCRVVGIAGGEEKCRFLVEELGFDGAID